MKRKIISCFISCFLFSTAITAQTDKKNTYNVGYDPITQGLYLGFDHAIHNYSIGLDLGSSLGLVMPLNVSLCLDNAYFFGKQNKYNMKTWHVNARLAYSKLLVENKPNILYIVPSIGKTFSLNEKLGLNIELGYGFQVLDDWGKSMTGGNSITYYYGGVSNPNIRIELKF
ncbi:MAG: hypothetical protein PHR83_16140 [Paludibacter sp.]|nr:hypothetical protein [Paludibacter sp.]